LGDTWKSIYFIDNSIETFFNFNTGEK